MGGGAAAVAMAIRQEGREGEVILMILSNVPLFETRNQLIDSPPEVQKKCFGMRITGDTPGWLYRSSILLFQLPEIVSGGTRGLTTKRM